MTFTEKLAQLLRERAMTEGKLAEASGVPFGTLHDYLTGRRAPTFAAVLKIAKALGLSCEAFADCEFPDERPRPASTIPTAPPRARTRRPMPGKPKRRPDR